MSGPMIWHDEADRWATWGTLDPPNACMCTECVSNVARRTDPTRATAAESALAEVTAERDEARAAIDRVRALADEWGIAMQDGGLVGDEDFAEAIHESGAWRFARDLRAALDPRPANRRRRPMSDYRAGDVADVEGRRAVYIPTRWEWLDGTWTAIPLSVGPVLGNVFDLAPADRHDATEAGA